ncbi:OCIA domain-containing protein 1-like isoform X2 [Lethenteron reissneri]|uniref:OCIA domain-containing protein 1-like isoform X2 n=1 Tax=Lethenteron reissneri TaxID=7753 RepID=UPI002AB7D639|nr:OCIA domain-containing protein 1-like isoform X2 [Lethenteron reissneri]
MSARGDGEAADDPRQSAHGGEQAFQANIGYIPTEEERKVLKECKKDSIYRAVPLSLAAMAGTHYLVSIGRLSPSPRFGSIPKVFFAGMFGYFIGRISYIGVCRDRILRLENSPLANAMRKGGKLGPAMFQEKSSGCDTHSIKLKAAPHTSVGSESSVSEDVDIPVLDAYVPYDAEEVVIADQKVTEAFPQLNSLDSDQQTRAYLSYDQLRSQNRDNFEQSRRQNMPPTTRPPPRQPDTSAVKKNQYGDEWEE